jgi:hypothetical protein
VKRQASGGHVAITALEEGPFTTLRKKPLTVRLDVPAERLMAGPTGSRFAVQVGGDSRIPTVIGQTEHDEPWTFKDIPCPNNLEDLLGDRAFLAQHAYATAASTLELFETTLGRRLGWRGRVHQLTLKVWDAVPYELSGYDGQRGDIRFGHFEDRRARHHVPIALFRDIVAHEVTHAILDGYRPHFSDPDATIDEHALHEGVADAVAMLSVFATTSRVQRSLEVLGPGADHRAAPSDALITSGLFDIADGLSPDQALRRSIARDVSPEWRTEQEPHRRGEVLVNALMRTVLVVWRERIKQLGDNPSDFLVAEAGARAGRQVLRMLIRGLGYTPPVNATFEDVLRGIVAADRAVIPDDDYDYRTKLQKAFSDVGISATDDNADGLEGLEDLSYPIRLSSLGSDPEEVYRFLWDNPRLLTAAAIDRGRPFFVERVRPSLRVGPDGFVVAEVAATFTQSVALTQREARRFFGTQVDGPVSLRGGGLLRFDEGGRLAYASLKPVLDVESQRSLLGETAGPPVTHQSESQIAKRRAAVFMGLHPPSV